MKIPDSPSDQVPQIKSTSVDQMVASMVQRDSDHYIESMDYSFLSTESSKKHHHHSKKLKH